MDDSEVVDVLVKMSVLTMSRFLSAVIKFNTAGTLDHD